jgi:hypothetical protein
MYVTVGVKCMRRDSVQGLEAYAGAVIGTVL